MGKYSALSHLGFGKESTWGTAVAATKWLAVTNPKPEQVIKMVEDKGYRAAFGETAAEYQGVRHAAFDFETMFYPDDAGLLLLALFGQDTVTGTAAPYSHAFALSAAQPPSYTLHDFDGINQKPYAGMVLGELAFKFAIDGELQTTAKWTGKIPGMAETADTPSFSAAVPALGWMATAKIGGVSNLNLTAFDLTLKREVLVQFTAQGSQDPKLVHVGRLTASGKLTFEPEDDTEITYFTANTQPSLEIDIITGQSSNKLTFTMTNAAFKKGTENRSKVLVEREFDFDAVGATSPITATLINSVASY